MDVVNTETLYEIPENIKESAVKSMKYKDLIDIQYVKFLGVKEQETDGLWNSLRLFFDRCEASDIPEDFQLNDEMVLKNTYPIESTGAKIIQIDFKNYIGYSILNESFTSWDDYELFEGMNTFRIYLKSRFLDYITSGTFASEQYPGPYKHYGIVCLNHIINIVSASEPTISEVSRL